MAEQRSLSQDGSTEQLPGSSSSSETPRQLRRGRGLAAALGAPWPAPKLSAPDQAKGGQLHAQALHSVLNKHALAHAFEVGSPA